VATIDEQDLELSVELIGLFERLNSEPEPDPNKTMEFVEQRALFVLWAILNQFIKQVTANMGMEPLNFKIPADFKLTPELSEQS
jgi:hypothetical protein